MGIHSTYCWGVWNFCWYYIWRLQLSYPVLSRVSFPAENDNIGTVCNRTDSDISSRVLDAMPSTVNVSKNFSATAIIKTKQEHDKLPAQSETPDWQEQDLWWGTVCDERMSVGLRYVWRLLRKYVWIRCDDSGASTAIPAIMPGSFALASIAYLIAALEVSYSIVILVALCQLLVST